MAEDFQVGGPPPEESSNRTFLIVAGGIGALLVLSMIFLGLYALVLAPRMQQNRISQATQIVQQNTQVAQQLTQTAAAGRATFTPPPTNTPLPTDTPTPSWEYQLAELFSAPSTANILSIVVAIQNQNNAWIPGLQVVGVDPNGIVTKSEPSADHETGHTPADSSVIKSGNTKFEPQPKAVYITGTWTFHLETVDGRQVSPSFTVNMDVENREWYFFRFTPNG